MAKKRIGILTGGGDVPGLNWKPRSNSSETARPAPNVGFKQSRKRSSRSSSLRDSRRPGPDQGDGRHARAGDVVGTTTNGASPTAIAMGKLTWPACN